MIAGDVASVIGMSAICQRLSHERAAFPGAADAPYLVDPPRPWEQQPYPWPCVARCESAEQRAGRAQKRSSVLLPPMPSDIASDLPSGLRIETPSP
jgi:hypothetical protein